MSSLSSSSAASSSTQNPLTALFEVDKTRDLAKITTEIVNCFKQHGLTLQQVETSLRDNHCFTHLIARKRNESHGDELEFRLPDGTVKTYYLFMTTKDEKFAMEELQEESGSYEENFRKLKDTGFMTINEEKLLMKKIASYFKSGFLEINPEFFEYTTENK